MKNLLKRTLGLVLVLTLLATMMMPGAFAAKSKPVTNPTKFNMRYNDTKFLTYTGMISNLALVDSNGVAVDVNNYKWSSSKKSVVKVSKTGVITAQKPGKATITATNKSNKKDKCKIVVHVQKNKVDNLCTKPTTSMLPYKAWDLVLKSVEIASPTKIVAEYYIVQNFPSFAKAIKLKNIDDEILIKRTASSTVETIAAGMVKNVKYSAKGAKVKTVKVTYKGAKAYNTNICLKDLYVVGDHIRDAHLSVTPKWAF